MEYRYSACPDCGKRAVHIAIASVSPENFFGDWENGEGNESIYGDESPPGDEIIRVYAHFCYECGKLVDLGIEDPRELDNSTRQIAEIRKLFRGLRDVLDS